MRIVLVTVAVLLSGCAGTQKVGQTASPDIPVVRERPKLSERQKVHRERQDRQAGVDRTEVRGEYFR